MPHTFRVQSFLRSVGVTVAILVCSLFCDGQSSSWAGALARARQLAPEARIVILNASTGNLLAAQRLEQAERTLAAPGSTLKPLVLYSLMADHLWFAEQRVACDRKLSIANHRLQCTHPAAPPYDARGALSWSCNSYFAAVARSIKPEQLGRLLRPTGLLSATGLVREEAVADFREPRTVQATQLTVLGIENIRVTPLELAAAYRWLAVELNLHSNTVSAQTLRHGLEDSASFGMAGPASLGGVPVMGKTGTAESFNSSRTHGWFAGLAPAGNPRVVVVVYLPAGRGADAARVAGELLAHGPLERQ
jgi:cell division protein FtsI/penicillin-binding protein 2